MSAEVISLLGHRRKHRRAEHCVCDSATGYTCYPHRLVDLLARMDDLSTDVESIQFCDISTYRRLTADIAEVLGGIVDDCLPDERTAR